MKPVFVLDANMALAWTLGETEAADKTKAARVALETAFARSPSVWPYEVINAIVVSERTGRIRREFADRALVLLADLPVRIRAFTHAELLQDVVPLARKHQLTSYDASYLALAILDSLPIATLDRNLIAAAGNEGVPVFAG